MFTAASIPAPPLTQVLQSITFVRPPLDGSLTFPQLLDWQSQHSSNHPLFVFWKDGKVINVSWGEVVKAIHNGVRILRSALGQNESTEAPVVGILALSDSLTYFTAVASIIRAGYVAFPISPRNSPFAVAHLINASGLKHILVGREQSMRDLANNSLEAWKTVYLANHTCLPTVSPIPSFAELSAFSDHQTDIPVYEKKGLDQVALYLHSSGSTAYPKVVPRTHRHLLEMGVYPYYGEVDLTGKVFSIHCAPLYHVFGLLHCIITATCGVVLSIYAPESPTEIPTANTIIENARATQCNFISCVPSVIEAWHKNVEYVKWLATCEGILFGGGPLDKSVGNDMVSRGVRMFILYGLTEISGVSPFVKGQPDADWEYFQFCHGSATPEFIQYDEETYELILVENERCHPCLPNMIYNGKNAYATNDLLTPHPSKPGYWKIFGRADDQIMHSNGEKTNPGPLETILNQDSHIQSSVMFGRGKFQAGVIIDLKPAFKFDPCDEDALDRFRDRIWPSVEKLNNYAPRHSWLFKEMILVAKPSKPFTYTVKNTPRRGAVIIDYTKEIEAAYDKVGSTGQTNIPLPDNWDIDSVTIFVRRVIGSFLVCKITDNDDIFQHGCDSLQATWIRNVLSRAINLNFKADTRRNTENFVYNYPTIAKLSAFFISNVSGNVPDNSSILDRQREMEQMVAKYSANFRVHHLRGAIKPARKTLILTGSSGGVGAFILSELVSSDNVERVYCINRPASPGSKSILDRHRDSFADKGLPLEVLKSQKIVLLEAQVFEQNWGLSHEVYNQMLKSTTHIIHNAWPVDFNLSLASFEANIQGLRNIIDFALESPFDTPTPIVYTSSIGVFQNLQILSTSQPEKLLPAAVAVSNGYNESKWVSEQVLAAASASTPLKTITVRLGQVSGGPNGFWDTKQWLPAIAQSAKHLGCFPDTGKSVSFIPAHVSARALIDFTEAPETAVIHLTHPNPTLWTVIANALASELGVPLVPYSEWFLRLENTASTAATSQVSALRLMGFFKRVGKLINANAAYCGAFGLPHLDNNNAVSCSPSLSEVEPLSAHDARAWFAYWKGAGFV